MNSVKTVVTKEEAEARWQEQGEIVASHLASVTNLASLMARYREQLATVEWETYGWNLEINVRCNSGDDARAIAALFGLDDWSRTMEGCYGIDINWEKSFGACKIIIKGAERIPSMPQIGSPVIFESEPEIKS